MDERERSRLRKQCAERMDQVFTRPIIMEALDWGEAEGNANVYGLMRDHREDLWQTWQAFSSAESAAAARSLVARLDPLIRRLLVIWAIHVYGIRTEGEVPRFLDPDGAPLDIPRWMRRPLG